MKKKCTENEILAKGNNSCKSMLNATKVKLDLYYVKTNPYTKFQVNIPKDDWEKFGKLSGRTDWQDRRTDRMTDGEETYILPPQTEFFLYFQSISQCCLSLVVFTYLGKDSFTWVNNLLRHKSHNDVTSWLTQDGAVF